MTEYAGMQALLLAAVALLQLAFTAGGVYVVVKQTRKDVNGVGMRLRYLETLESHRYQKITLAMMTLAAERDSERIAALLEDCGLGKG